MSCASAQMDALGEQIRRIEARDWVSREFLPFGVAEIDERLPRGGWRWCVCRPHPGAHPCTPRRPRCGDEDRTGTANLVIWLSLYEKQRQVVHGAHMLAVEGRVQREGLVVHIMADRLIDLSAQLDGIGETEDEFQLPHGRGDEFHHGGGGTDSRNRPPRKIRDIYVPDLHIDTLKRKPRNFR